MTEPTTTDWRALITRMADELDHYRQLLMDDRRATHALAAEARAVLAQPEPVAPTDEELPMPAAIRDMPEQQQRWYALGWRAALARYARPTTQPVPVSERPWKREGWCDAEGRCYGWDGDYWWMVGNPGAANETITHWLPANALPTPEATND